MVRAVTDELAEAMTEGIPTQDAEENSKRLFVEFVGFLGDTPGINHVLDIFGHNGRSSFHVCKFTRASLSLRSEVDTDDPTYMQA